MKYNENDSNDKQNLGKDNHNVVFYDEVSLATLKKNACFDSYRDRMDFKLLQTSFL